jgi:hypothetical protein
MQLLSLRRFTAIVLRGRSQLSDNAQVAGVGSRQAESSEGLAHRRRPVLDVSFLPPC